MKIIDVLIVIDIEGVLSSNDLQGNLYLIDTNHHVASETEGQAIPKTGLSLGDSIQWSVKPVQPNGQVAIVSFSGQAVQEKVIQPTQSVNGNYWSSQFKTTAEQGTVFPYTLTLDFEGKQLAFDLSVFVAETVPIIDILMVVDIKNALTQNNLQNNVYSIDTHKYDGSVNEGQSDLITALSSQDYIRWSVVPVQLDTQIAIVNFSSQAVQDQVIQPQVDLNGTSWISPFNTTAEPGTAFPYTVTLELEDKQLSFDLSLLVKGSVPTVALLMVVDVEGALSSDNLQDNIYLVDTNKYVGSGIEGQSKLKTVLSPGNNIQWSVKPVQPQGQVAIASFSGQAVQDQVIQPQVSSDGKSWSSTFKTTAEPGTSFSYTATVELEGKQLAFAPFLSVK